MDFAAGRASVLMTTWGVEVGSDLEVVGLLSEASSTVTEESIVRPVSAP